MCTGSGTVVEKMIKEEKQVYLQCWALYCVLEEGTRAHLRKEPRTSQMQQDCTASSNILHFRYCLDTYPHQS